MSKSVVFGLLAALFVVLPLSADTPAYDRSKELVLEGNVIYVAQGELGMFVIMKDRAASDGQLNEVTVQLAPVGFLKSQGVALTPGGRIRIVGSRVQWNGSETILAREVSQNGKTVVLPRPE